ncbi:MAG TPA: glycosyltransferase family 4 protein [Gaiellales bacterium]|nr:glycosyltransferase family 4 protein [Gaiellales bacterium]
MSLETRPSRTPRVLHVAQPQDGGSIVCAANLVADQARRGWHVAAATCENELSRTTQRCGGTYLPWEASRSPGISVLGETRRLCAIISRFDPDVIHLHSSKAGLCGRLAIRGRRPTLYQPHGWSFYAVEGLPRQGALGWERFATRWTSTTVCVSADEKVAGEAHGVCTTWAVIPNGVDAQRWQPASASRRAHARARLGVARGTPLVVTVGRLAHSKGIDVLLKAWRMLSVVHPEARLVVVGDGPDREHLDSTCPQHAELVGAADPTLYLAAGDLFVAPSRWEAGASLAVMEAMAQGLPVVATRVNGMASILDERCLVPVGEPDEMVRVISGLLDDPTGRRQLGKRNRALVETHRSLTATLASTAELTQLLRC